MSLLRNSICALAVAALAVVAGGCGPRDDYAYVEPPTVSAERASIDTDATLTGIEPGQGVGIFVEYTTGGTWRITTSCDTEVSQAACAWDVIATTETGSTATLLATEGIGSGDEIYTDGAGIHFRASVTDRLEGFSLAAVAGDALVLDVYLDEAPEQRFHYWVGGGALHRGAPSNPLVFDPTSP
jgi:hypothetical protein